jgi:pilus assembly protein Flp/PilA
MDARTFAFVILVIGAILTFRKPYYSNGVAIASLRQNRHHRGKSVLNDGGYYGREMTKLRNFLRDESGATAIEYGLIAACISIAIVAVVVGVGSKLNSTFTQVQNALPN